MNKTKTGIVFTILGSIAIVTGLLLAAIYESGTAQAFSFTVFGAGFGALGAGLGILIGTRKKVDPELQKQWDIAENDERNITVNLRAKASSYTVSLFVFMALVLALTILNIPLPALFLAIGAYLIHVGSFIFFLFRYNKQI